MWDCNETKILTILKRLLFVEFIVVFNNFKKYFVIRVSPAKSFHTNILELYIQDHSY